MRRGAVTLSVLALLASGCTPAPDSAPSGMLASFYSQHLTWTSCGTGLECANAVVPLDYEHPDGAVLRLPVLRRRAPAGPRTGTVFVNPGGPGASGTSFAARWNVPGLEHADVVGWDPRGIGVTCLQGREADAFNDLDFSPDTPAELDALLQAERRFAAACEASSGALLAHASTQESARDLDVLRAALGEERLDFYGASYGTLLGAVYAELFPDKVRRLVLDSPVDATGRPPTVAGFEAAFGDFASWCAGSGCRWGQTRQAVLTSLTAWVRDLDSHPVAVGDRVLTQSRVAYGAAQLLYAGASSWPALRVSLEAAQDGDGKRLLEASDQMLGRRKDGSYAPIFAALPAIYCADQPRRIAAEAEAAWTAEARSEPFFGYLWGPDVTCTDWPVRPQPWLTPKAAGTAGVLVVGVTGDPATPYQNAVTLAQTLASATLLTLEGSGHGALGRSECVDAAVAHYLTQGVPPPDGTHCS